MVYIKKTYEAVYEIKKSVFTATLTPIDDESLIKPYLESLKALHPKSHHIAYAYSLNEGMIQRKSDDKEPKDTAGLPILNAINQSELSNVILTVRRDYGGILLGSSGLFRAYLKAALLAISKAALFEKAVVLTFILTLTYKAYDVLNPILKTYASNLDTHFKDFIEIKFDLLKSNHTSFIESLNSKYPHPLDLKIIEEKMTYVPKK